MGIILACLEPLIWFDLMLANSSQQPGMDVSKAFNLDDQHYVAKNSFWCRI